MQRHSAALSGPPAASLTCSIGRLRRGFSDRGYPAPVDAPNPSPLPPLGTVLPPGSLYRATPGEEGARTK